MKLKIGEKFKLECGHDGKVVYVDSASKIWVKGTRRGCRVCGKGAAGEWAPTVYLLTLSE
jgi:hypothetical protein